MVIHLEPMAVEEEEQQQNQQLEGEICQVDPSETGCCAEGEATIEDPSGGYYWPVFDFDRPPRRLYHFGPQFRTGDSDNFMKGVKWSPDGSGFLTSSDDNTLRLFYLPEDTVTDCSQCADADINHDSFWSTVVVNEAETAYDFCWYPYMCASDPSTCVFASTTRDHPIHMWDAITGQLRCTYRAYNQVDEITAALSVSFNSSGSKLFAGYDKTLRIFDVHRPGRNFEEHSLAKKKDCSLGIISSIAFSPANSGMFALGSYSQRTAIFMEDNMELLYVLHGQVGGVTQVLFSKDGNYLYTGGRKDPYILCWDIRNTVGIVYQLYRSTEHTNQRISFDIEPCGRHLGTGGQDGLVHIYDLQTGEWKSSFQAASDTVNGFSFHPSMPLAASSSGNRRFSMPEKFEETSSIKGDENCAAIWSFSYPLQVDDSSVVVSGLDPEKTEEYSKGAGDDL